MSKKDNETIKEYAQRWRELAAQVEPPLSDKEMVGLFMDTLQNPYYDKMIGSMSSSFSDLVITGERIERGIRRGKFASVPTGENDVKKPSSGFAKKGQGETNAIMNSKNS